MTELEKARAEINAVDSEMAQLFCRRMKAVRAVAEYKRERGLPVSDPTRETEVIARNALLVEDEELRSYFVTFLENNMAVSRRYQHRLLEGMRVAFSGVKGAFAEIAAVRAMPDATAVPYGDFQSAYDSVVRGECDCAILPIENNIGGDVGQVMDLAFFGPLSISGVYDVEIVQNLLAVKGASIGNIRQVISHPQAISQCAEYIRRHGFESIEAVNTAVAARTVAESGRTDIAAIGSDEAAAEYGLQKLEGGINRSNKNTTRFAVFTRLPVQSVTAGGRFIMTFTVNNEAGSLGRAVAIIGDHGFNLRALKSRPTKSLQWDYYFYVEGDGNISNDNGSAMLAELAGVCNSVRVLGSYDREISL
ncbi:MAG: prephenate dehydratase domain-containing protein [Firmicutes bacterium]|nr:prephenate dehydratase domain-containing protein [Bacillota bacterium]